MARCDRRRPRERGPRPRAFPDRAGHRQVAASRRVHAFFGKHRLYQHDSRRTPAPHAGRPCDRGEDPQLCALERDGDGHSGEQAYQRRRTHCELRIGSDALRRRVQPFLARSFRQPRRRPGVRARTLVARYLRSRLHARSLHRRADGQLPPGGRRQGHIVVSASLADARFLAVPDGVDGPGAADGDLSGAVHEVPAGPRAGEDRGAQGLVLLRRRRNGRA